jgi:hypothetical protein
MSTITATSTTPGTIGQLDAILLEQLPHRSADLAMGGTSLPQLENPGANSAPLLLGQIFPESIPAVSRPSWTSWSVRTAGAIRQLDAEFREQLHDGLVDLLPVGALAAHISDQLPYGLSLLIGQLDQQLPKTRTTSMAIPVSTPGLRKKYPAGAHQQSGTQRDGQHDG